MEKTWILPGHENKGVSPQDKKDHYHMDGQTVGYNDSLKTQDLVKKLTTQMPPVEVQEW